MKFPIKNQYIILLKGLKAELLTLEKFKKGTTNNTNKLASRAITPQNLEGIDLNIA